EYRLVSYRDAAGAAEAGVLVGDRVFPPARLLGDLAHTCDTASVIGLLRQWDKVHPRLAAAAGEVDAGEGLPLAELVLDAPILYPGALFCAGANYWDHLQEMAAIAARTSGKAPSLAKSAEPWFFLKTTAGSIIGTGAPACLPGFAKQVDWEAELGVVIA